LYAEDKIKAAIKFPLTHRFTGKNTVTQQKHDFSDTTATLCHLRQTKRGGRGEKKSENKKLRKAGP
jgi:hypothetical protein